MRTKTDRFILYSKDCLEALKRIPDNYFDSCVTDPPYGLSKEPDIRKVMSYWLNDKQYRHKHGGFMSKEWDSFVPGPEYWSQVYRVLKPGAHCLVFASTRTYDLMTVSLRFAGFEIRDCIRHLSGLHYPAWVHGQGFPKSFDIGKGIDKRRASNNLIRPWLRSLGSRKEIAKAAQVSTRQVDHWLGDNTPCPQTLTLKRFRLICHYFGSVPDWSEQMFPQKGKLIGTKRHSRSGSNDFAKRPGANSCSRTEKIYEPATSQAKQWKGWGSALKPAWEPIILVRKPIHESIVENVLKHGTGGINIEGTRIGYSASNPPIPQIAKNKRQVNSTKSMYDGQSLNKSQTKAVIGGSSVGRFPANVVVSHHPECKKIDKYVGSGPTGEYSYAPTYQVKGFTKNCKPNTSSKRGLEEVEEWDCHPLCPTKEYKDILRFFFCAKAGTKERNEGVNGKSSRSQQTYSKGRANCLARCREHDESLPSGSTVYKCGCSLQYQSEQEGRRTETKNIHPTVKPLDLMKYLVRLVTPKNGICLDPFMGSGTTGVACAKEGFKFVGIEKEVEYFDISRQRILHAYKNRMTKLFGD